MRVFDSPSAPGIPRGCVATIGNFDGVHRGHARILDGVVREARCLSVGALLLTFRPHPVKVLRPDAAPAHITTREQWLELVEGFGLDAILEYPFTKDLTAKEPEVFVREVLAEGLGVRRLVLGANFRFGHLKRGDIGLLKELGRVHGFEVDAVPAMEFDGGPISSSRIRVCVREGRASEAAAMLGRPFEMTGIVGRGARRGQRLGFPTLNLLPENELGPGDGIYIGEVLVPSVARWLPTAVSVGTNPTFGRGPRVMEGYILDFSDELYDARVRMRLLRKLRDQEAFPSIETLREAIARDVEAVRRHFAGGG